jgi:outer membrane receptor protein involved in Fe transport
MAIDTPPTVESVVVRPIRLPAPAGDPAFSIIRLDQAAVQASPRLDESLGQVPSFSLFRRTSSLAANPTTQGASLRAIAGSGASRALVTLDGVPQNDPFGGWVIWSALPSDLIQSAEIVRGAGAGPYGAGALTGVVGLSEADAAPGGIAADASYGSLGDVQGQAIASARFGSASLLVGAAGESAHGFVPVRYGAGAADRPLTLHDWSTSARLTDEIGPGVLAARISAFQEDRGAGLAGAGSRAAGQQASLSYTRAPTERALGYRLQAWVFNTGLENTSVAIATNRATATPSNDQYATPAIGYGFNAAVRRATRGYSWEIGADVRAASGQSEELYSYAGGRFTRSRVTGGASVVGGVYVEAARDLGPWLLTGGARVDGWGDMDTHRVERLIATGAASFDQHPADRGGALPSARLGLRRDLDGGYFLRTAGYAGFRPATLNELDRPFRVGGDLTEANPNLKPEKLYGVEAGVGADGTRGAWSLTAFANRLQDAIINVTVAHGPVADPFDPVGNFVAAGGTLYQRRNVDHVDALGLEGEAHRALTDTLDARVAADYTWARVDGGGAARQLTGLRPAETPRFAATAGLDWRALPRLTLSADARYESARYDDDLNTRRLAPGVTVDARAQLRLTGALYAYVAADNIFDAGIQTGRTAANVVSYDAPRTVRVGLRWRR